MPIHLLFILSMGFIKGSMLWPVFIFDVHAPTQSNHLKSWCLSPPLCRQHSVMLYVPLQPNNPSSLDNLFACLKNVKWRLSQNFFKLNDYKTEITAIGATKFIRLGQRYVGSLFQNMLLDAWNLGVCVCIKFPCSKFYIQDLLTSYVPGHSLRSVHVALSWLVNKGDLSIAVHAPRLWKSNLWLIVGILLKSMSAVEVAYELEPFSLCTSFTVATIPGRCFLKLVW